MPITNRMLNAQKEQNCLGITPEQKYYHVNGSFIKRSLRPEEWQLSPFKGTTHVPRQGIERILNEEATLTYIKDNTDIPVPTVLACFEDTQAAYLITNYVEGVSMSALTPEQKTVVTQELELHIKTMHSLRSSKLGGLAGHVIVPYRMLEKTPRDEWNMRDAVGADYVFCHHDLSQANVIVDPISLKINAIIDWEYAGFFPQEFDLPFYKYTGPLEALNSEGDDTDKFIEFLDHCRA